MSDHRREQRGELRKQEQRRHLPSVPCCVVFWVVINENFSACACANSPSASATYYLSNKALLIQRKGRVRWAHVPSHSQHKWNDRADELSVMGTKLTLATSRATRTKLTSPHLSLMVM